MPEPRNITLSISVLFLFQFSFYLTGQIVITKPNEKAVNPVTDSIKIKAVINCKTAYSKALEENTIDAFNKFILSFPSCDETKSAQTKIQHLAFQKALFLNTALEYQHYLKSYPSGNWINVAQDSLFSKAKSSGDSKLLKYCVDNFKGQRRDNALKAYYDLITTDGEVQSLDLFYRTYGNVIPIKQKSRDFDLTRQANKLLLHLPYSDWKFPKYDEYIRQAAPREKAFVALQRMIAADISVKNWSLAIKKMKNYSSCFGTKNKNYNELISVLNTKWNNTIRIISVGKNVNTDDGGEYSPVVTANEEQLYFCGTGRRDNVGGEDIFVSKKEYGNWSKARVVPELSSKISNEAPISISSDGNTLLLFRSGKLWYSLKTQNGWAKPVEYPKVINSTGFQLDGMMTSDGKGLLFSSTRSGGYNYLNQTQKFHGDELYPSDIYISLLTPDKKWGEPINLGPVINTAFCERTPFLHADMKTLYFSSDGHGGLGKLDVFKSTRLADTCWNCWSEPVNLGKEINTELSDVGYKVTTSGEKAYFSYERKANSNSSILLLLDVSGSTLNV